MVAPAGNDMGLNPIRHHKKSFAFRRAFFMNTTEFFVRKR
jgi:hypothetical protein